MERSLWCGALAKISEEDMKNLRNDDSLWPEVQSHIRGCERCQKRSDELLEKELKALDPEKRKSLERAATRFAALFRKRQPKN